jgi:serine/threonine protein kinase
VSADEKSPVGKSNDGVGSAHETDPALGVSGLGSGLLARQPTPQPEEAIAILKVCPQCGTEYETGSRFCLKDGSPLRPKSGNDPLVGRVIADRYLILALLGEGGMGRVYLAEHVKMNRQCAIKVMNPSLLNDHESGARFAREASNAARILHPNVAAVFDFGESEKIVYLVMEYVDGESLSQILAREGRIDPRRAVEIARQVADGLSAAHELGIVHRDLKPDNIIVAQQRGGREIPKVVDFGIAKAVSDSPQDALTRSGLVIGTPEYMSPEQLLGDPVDARADIYSLGCILYQMLVGSPAFAAESREQMIRRRLHEPPPHAREEIPDLPRRLDTTIARMLARSPGDRMASAAELRDALDPALVLGSWVGSAATARRTAQAIAPTISAERAGAQGVMTPTVPLKRQRMNGRRIGIVTTVIAMVTVGAVVATKQFSRTHVDQGTLPTQTAADSVARADSARMTNSVRADSLRADSIKLAAAAAALPSSPAAPVSRKRDSMQVSERERGVKPPNPALSSPAGAMNPPANSPGPSKEVLAIDSAFAPLRLAIASGNMTPLENAAPQLDKQIHDFFQRLFQNSRRIRRAEVKMDGAPSISAGDRVDVRVLVTVQYDDSAAQPRDIQLNVLAELLKGADGWKLSRLVKSPSAG